MNVSRLPAADAFVSQTVYARAWSEWWDTASQKWVGATWLNGGKWSTTTVSAGFIGYFGNKIQTGRVNVTSPYYERISFEVVWSGSPSSFNAHKYYRAGSNEYWIRPASGSSTTRLNTPYCYI